MRSEGFGLSLGVQRGRARPASRVGARATPAKAWAFGMVRRAPTFAGSGSG